MKCLQRIIWIPFCLLALKGFSQPSNLVDITRELPENYVKDAGRDYTEVLQKLIDKYDRILMPDIPLLINDKGLNIGSNKTIYFQPHTKLILKPSGKSKYTMILIQEAKNVKIIGAKLEGDRDKHKGKKGEWGMGIRIEGGRNIEIKNAEISNTWGDGIYIARGKTNPEHIRITNGVFEKNRRNGISIISGSDITVSNSTFDHIDGTLPMAGVDIEPNSREDELGRIDIENIRTGNCNSGVQISLRNYPSKNERKINITIKGLKSSNDNHGLRISDLFRKEKYGPGIKPLKGSITIANARIKDVKKEPILYFRPRGYEYSPQVILNNIDISPLKGGLKPEALKIDLKKRGFNVQKF